MHAYHKNINFQSLSLPLSTDTEGIIHVGKTRVTLDTVISAFRSGATAEEIAYQYSSLKLPDIYTVIGYYLNNKAQINKYLQYRLKKRESVQKQNETAFDPSGIRERLLLRKTKTIK